MKENETVVHGARTEYTRITSGVSRKNFVEWPII